ncbi:MAG: hypothetical protein IKP90_00660 [Fibrobacter sp.]|nr:hypothetical protein [Fibrobacter sp.]
MKTLNTFSSVAAMLPATAFALAAAVSLTACGNDNTAGTDEQQNSITAKLDSALTEWLAGDTLIAPDISSEPCTDCPHDFLSHDDPAATQVPKIQTENGYLYHVRYESFESIVCENDSNWFVYSISVNDSVTQKGLTLPDSSTAEAFEADCEEEGGAFVADSIAVVDGQHNFRCSLTNLAEGSSSADRTKYVDANWKKYVKLIVGFCRN